MSPAIPFKQTPYGACHPPTDGSLFLPEMVEFNAKRNPNHPFYTFQDKHNDDLRYISHLEFHRACHRVAHAVRPNRHGPDTTIVGIIANCDTILYQALTMGLIFAGIIPFPMSPRNSPAAVVNMVQKTGCRRLIATRHSLGLLLDGVAAVLADLQIEDPPTLAYTYPELGEETESSPFIPYPKAKERPLKDDIMYYLHSSGSTGFPKPIPMTYLNALHWCIMPSVQEHVNLPKHITVCAAALPPFHTIGVLLQLFFPVTSLKTIAVYPPTSYHDPIIAPIMPTPKNTIEMVQLTKSGSLLVVPAFLEEWASSSQVVDVLSSLEYVAFAGGPLPKKTGDGLVAAGVNLASVYGGTEFGPLTCMIRDPAEKHLWEWIRFGPNQNFRWVSQGDGTYECQVLTGPTHQPSLENLPDVRGYATADVFIKHPAIEGLYKFVGRLDDVLIHSSGEKTVPAPMETVIGSSPILSGVCMFGRGRNQAGVLVEPRPEYAIDVKDDKQVAEFRNIIWPEVEEANNEAPAFSRIFKEMIFVTSKDKPMLRAGKGTVIKKATMALYESEIDALYASVEASARAGIDVPLPSPWSQTEVENWLMVHATAVNAGRSIQVDMDLFEQGFDSLSSTLLKNRVIGSLSASSQEKIRAAASRISQNTIFTNPTLLLLAQQLIQFLDGDVVSPPTTSNPKADIEDMIAKYSVRLDKEAGDATTVPGMDHHGHVALLTGSTGGLGSYLLASLLSREDVATVYALNRPSETGTIKQRQRAAFEDRGLDTALLQSAKLIHVEGGNAAQPNLCLDDQMYSTIRDSVTVIIHSAWRLDFNLALSSFEPNVRGTRNLIDLARGSKRVKKPRFLFTSSVSSAQGWDKRKGRFPEEVQYDAEVAVGTGYGASKYVCERILAASGLPATSFRIGQITGGAPRGAWSSTDWVPMLIKSSVSLGAFPDACGVVSWLTPETVSDAMLDVAFAADEPPPTVNLVHSRPVTWTSLIRPISEALYQKRVTPSPLPLILFAQWVEQLDERATGASEEDVRRVPAIKLVGFMRRLAHGDAALRHQLRSPDAASNNAHAAAKLTKCTADAKDAQDGKGEVAEVGDLARFTTDVAQRVSGTMRRLVPLNAMDAERWVDYWDSMRMCS